MEGTLDETAAGAAVEAVGLSVIDWASRLTAKHIFTHVEWRMTGYALTVRGDGPAELEWVGCGRPCGALCAVGVCPVL